jgi:hypothetical protein
MKEVNILEGDILGHCEIEVRKNMCLILNGLRNRAVWIYEYKRIVNGKKYREYNYCYFILTLL